MFDTAASVDEPKVRPEDSGSALEPAAGASGVRERLVGAFAALFVLEVILAGPLAEWALEAVPELAPGARLVRFLALAIGLPLAMAVLGRRVVRPAAEIEASRDELRDMYNRARLDALLDPLTGLGNHRAFQEELARQVTTARRHGRSVSLVLIDLDDLKRLNDERGHAHGDEVLISVGRLLASMLRRADRAFRVGGDEFAAILPDTPPEEAHVVVRRLLAATLEGRVPSGEYLPFSFSAGISAFPVPGPDIPRLYRQADAALYFCKRHGRTDVQVYDPTRHGSAGDQRTTPELAAAVSRVATRRALIPAYQPIYSLESGRPIGFEGLVRPSSDSGFPDAGSLFAAAELTSHTVDLDMAAIEVVAAGVGTLEPDQYVSLNVSPRTVEAEQFRVVDLLELLEGHGIAPSNVVLELTEREPIEDIERLRAHLDACRAAGMRIAADDVGAGNAGLRLLSQIRFDIVKIDLSLVQDGPLKDPSRAVLRALRELAERWNASLVAEGVETPTQLAIVHDLGMTGVQGYLLARPAPLPVAETIDIRELLDAGRRARDFLVGDRLPIAGRTEAETQTMDGDGQGAAEMRELV